MSQTFQPCDLSPTLVIPAMDEQMIPAKSFLRIDVRYSGGRRILLSSEFAMRCSIFGASRSYLPYYMKETHSRTNKIKVHAHTHTHTDIKQRQSMRENGERLLYRH